MARLASSAKRGVFAYIVDGDAQELQSAFDITLQRFAEYQSLQGAFGRRALIEQAKGILMARHSVDADRAFDMLRDHSQHNGRKVVDVAQAIVDSRLLLPPPLAEPAVPSPPRPTPARCREFVRPQQSGLEHDLAGLETLVGDVARCFAGG